MLKPNPRRFFKFTCNGKYSYSDLERFWPKVDTTPGFGPRGDCWEWRGGYSNSGYGSFRIGGQMAVASRVAWELSYNKLIPDGLLACHHCDNPSCVKGYEHLFLGTNADNIHDMENKGRRMILCGEKHGMSKLTWREVNEIRYKYNNTYISILQLSNIYMVTTTVIKHILNNKLWYDSDYIKTRTHTFVTKFHNTEFKDDAIKFTDILKKINITQKQFCEMVNFSKSLVSNWCTGLKPIPTEIWDVINLRLAEV